MGIEVVMQVYYEFFKVYEIMGYLFCKVDIEIVLWFFEDDCGVDIIFSLELVDMDVMVKLFGWFCFIVSLVFRDFDEWMEYCIGFVKVEILEKFVVVSKMGFLMDF